MRRYRVWMAVGGFIRRLERSSPLPGPSFDDDFLLREEFDGIAPLTVQIPKETLAGAAEGKKRHRCRHRDVDADISHLSFVPELSGAGAAAGEQARLIAVRARVD